MITSPWDTLDITYLGYILDTPECVKYFLCNVGPPNKSLAFQHCSCPDARLHLDIEIYIPKETVCHLWFKRPNMFCIVVNHNVDLLSWWSCKEWRIEVKLLESNLSACTAALLLWDWGKAVVFLRSRDGGTCDELWLDFAEMWLHLRLVQLQTMITVPNKVWAILLSSAMWGLIIHNIVLFSIVWIRMPLITQDYMTYVWQPKTRASWCQISRWSGYKGPKGHLRHDDGSPKECGLNRNLGL